MRYFAYIFLSVVVVLTAACSKGEGDPVSTPKEAAVEKESESKKEEVSKPGKEEEKAAEEEEPNVNAENQNDESYIHPELANNAKYVEVMNRIHDEPNQLEVTKEEQFAAVTKLFFLNPEVLDDKSRALGLSDAQLSDGTKMIYLAAIGERMGAFYFYHPGTDEIATELNAEEAFGEIPEISYE